MLFEGDSPNNDVFEVVPFTTFLENIDVKRDLFYPFIFEILRVQHARCFIWMKLILLLVDLTITTHFSY